MPTGVRIKQSKPVPLPSGRVRLTDAAEQAGYSRNTMWRLISAGVMTRADAPADRVHGAPAHVWRDELHVLMHEGKAACKAYRESKGRT